jgi:hypothetical protein
MAGSWESLVTIFSTAAQEREALDAQPPVACPNDGEPLTSDRDGRLHCRWDGWEWDGQPVRIY